MLIQIKMMANHFVHLDFPIGTGYEKGRGGGGRGYGGRGRGLMGGRGRGGGNQA